MRTSRVAEAASVLACSAAVAILLTWPLAFKIDRVARVDTFDGHWSIWVVSWVARTLVVDPRHLYDANIFYPHRNTLAYSENNLGAGALALPVYWATGNVYLAHNVVVLLSFTLAAAGAYYLVRHLTASRGAAAVSAVLFAFCPYIFPRLAHIQLLLTAGIPFSLLALHRVLDRPSIPRAIALGLALAAQVLSCAYYGVFAGLLVGLGAVFFGVSRRLWGNRTYRLALAVAAVVAVAIVTPFFLPYLREREAGLVRTLRDAQMFSADWRAYLASPAWAHRWMLSIIERWKEVLFPGFLATGLGLFGAWTAIAHRERRDVIAFYALVASLAFWTSFGPDAGLYTLLYYAFPVFTFLRAPARFGLIVTLALSVLAGFGVAHLLRGRRHPALIAAGLAMAAAAELAVIPLRLPEVKPFPAVYRTLAVLPDGPVLEMPFFWLREHWPRHAEYMLNSTTHWKPLINGYSDHVPPEFRSLVVPISSFPTLESFSLLSDRRPRYVVFHLDYYDHRSRAKLLTRIGEFGAYLRPLAQEGDVWLYEIVGWPR